MAGKCSRAAKRVFWFATALVGADLMIKFVLVRTLGHDSHLTDFGFVSFRLAYNTGATFSPVFGLPQPVVVTVLVMLVAGLIVLVSRSAARWPALSRAGAALLLSGGLGNLIDRLNGAGVVDYLHAGWFPAFNLADVFLVAGTLLLLLGTAHGMIGKER